jgi:cell division protein FtsW
MSSRERLRIYYKCLIVSIALLLFGSAMVMSASAPYALERTGDAFYFFKRHAIYFCVGLGFFFFFRAQPPIRLKRIGKYLLLISIVLLVLVLIVGHEVNGSRRSLGYSGIRFQPSELARFALIIYLADYLSRKRERISGVRLIKPAVVSGIIMLLLLLEPDFGSTFLVFLYTLTFFFLAGLNWKFIPGIVAAAMSGIVFLIKAEPYRWNRILAFFHPESDPQGIGYQVIQALITVGSGGWHGVGLGRGRQKLEFLPEAHKDYVFAVVGEELGFIGACAVLILFSALIISAFKISMRLRDPFARYLSCGIGFYFAYQVLLHTGVVVKILPPKGTTLPFFSYGGSSLVIGMAALGTLFGLIRYLEDEETDLELCTEIY